MCVVIAHNVRHNELIANEILNIAANYKVFTTHL